MGETKDKNQPLPADVARADSVGGMARRLANPAHLAELWNRSLNTLREEGAQQLWRDITFRVGLAFHHDSWQHRADLPTRRQLKRQRETPLNQGVVTVVVPLYNTPKKFFDQMTASVRKQTYPHWQLVLVDASDEDHRTFSVYAQKQAAKDPRITYKKVENGGIAVNTTAGFALAKGEWVTLLDHDDLLYPNALYECMEAAKATGADLVYTDEIVLSENLKELGGYHFKADWAPDNLRGCNYITHLAVFTRELLEKAGAAQYKEFDGAQDHDLLLRLTEKAEKITHIPKVMYIWRAGRGSTAAGMEAKPYAVAAGARAIQAHLDRVGLAGTVAPLEDAPGAFRVTYELTGEPLVSVLIPSKDHTGDLERCLSSFHQKAGYDNFEIIVIENNSTDPETFEYYDTLPRRYPKVRVVKYEGPFNFSAVNNYGRKFAKGKQLLLLNNDIEIESDGFLKELLSYSQRPDVGAVGAKLWYPDGTLQHGGVIMGINGSAGHSHKGYPRGKVGDMYRLVTTQDYMAVTGACLLTKAALYDEMGGLDEEQFAVAYNDIDYCLKLWEKGLLNVFTPHAQAVHYESKSRGLDTTGENARRYAREKANFYAKYHSYIDRYDPYYNPHFNNLFENFGLK